MSDNKDLEMVENLEYIPTQGNFLYTDENENDIYAHKCSNQYCNNFFSKRKKSKRTQCGCVYVENGRQRGKANKKTNAFYFPNGYDFGVCFYDNYDGYFIFDKEDYGFIKEHHCTALINEDCNRVDPICTINGKQYLLARLLMNTPDELEVDHINHDTNDLRKCNLRNCTKEQNSYNKKNAKQGVVKLRNDGKYIIVDFPKENVTNLVFTTREDALDVLFALQDKHFGEFGRRRSQEIAAKYQTDYFDHSVTFCNGILEEIQNLPEKTVYKIWLDNICRYYKSERISDILFGERLNELIVAYKNRDK